MYFCQISLLLFCRSGRKYRTKTNPSSHHPTLCVWVCLYVTSLQLGHGFVALCKLGWCVVFWYSTCCAGLSFLSCRAALTHRRSSPFQPPQGRSPGQGLHSRRHGTRRGGDVPRMVQVSQKSSESHSFLLAYRQRLFIHNSLLPIHYFPVIFLHFFRWFSALLLDLPR